MRYRYLGGLLISAWLGAWPLAAHADYMSSARAALRKGDLRSAQIELRNAVRSDPQNGAAHYWLGRVSLELGDPVAAEREAKAARARDFDPNLTIPLLAQSLLAQNKFKELLGELKPTGKTPDQDATILVFRGYAEIGLNNPAAAKKLFEQAAKTAPNALQPLLAEAQLAESHHDLAAAQNAVNRATAIQPKAPEVLLARARLLRIKRDFQGALKVLDELVKEQPGLSQGRLERASLELALGKKDAGKSDIDAVLKLMPGNVEAIYLRAVLAAENKDYQAANADLEKISPFISRIPRAYYLSGVVAEHLGQLAQAELSAQRYVARAPDDPVAYQLLARVQLERNRPDQAIATLSKIVDAGKANAGTYDLLGRAYAVTHRDQQAVDAFQKATALAPSNVGLQTRLAAARLAMGQPGAAMGDLEHTLQIAPKVPQVGEALFLAALATGDLNKAKAALTKVAAAQGDTAVVQNLQGMMKLAELDLNGARQIFANVVDKDPNFLPAKINLARVLAMQGNEQDAEKLLSGILTKYPVAEPALTMLTATYLRSNRLPKAIALVEKAHAAVPANLRLTASLGQLYIRAGTPKKALALADAENGTAASNPVVLGLKAAALLALGQKDKAISVDTALLQADPRQSGVRHQLVSLLVDAGNYEQARNVVQAGMSASPNDYQLFQDYVMIDLKAKGLDTALATARRLQSQSRGFLAAHALQGDIYLAANRPDAAIKAYQQALTEAPSTMLVMRLASTQLRAGKKDAAIKTLTDWTSKHPDDLAALEQLSEIQIAAGQLDSAVKTLQTLLDKKPHDPIALNNLAWVYQQQNNSRALGLARQAYVLAPSAQTADTLGWILTKSGRAQTGVDLLRQASSENRADPRILYHFAVALKDTGKKAEAIKLLNIVVSAKGNFTEKTEAQQLLNKLNKGA